MNKYEVEVFNTVTGKYEMVEVTKEVYEVYRRTTWNIEDNDASFYAHQTPISQLYGVEDDMETWERFDEFVAECELAVRDEIEMLAGEQERRALHKALRTLRKRDAELIKAIYFEGESEKQYGKRIGNCQQTVHRKKRRILRQLKEEILRNLE